jgi:predicted phage terminase large subunit-like protein
MSFVVRSFSELYPQATFLSSPYIELLASTLERCRNGKARRQIVNMPPRTLKSHVCSVAWPAWLLAHDPTAQIICVSYGQDLSDKHARDCRTLMNSSFYRRLFPETVLSRDKQSVDEFVTTLGGVRLATSVGGVLTGRGGDVLIIDDPLKPEDAMSETLRPGTNEWCFSTLQSRMNSQEDGVMLLLMQRLHQDDLVGAVTEREHWEVLSLPAIAEKDETYLIESPLGSRFYVRKAGEALHPERVSLERLEEIRRTVGSYVFQSQYQQNPTSREGGVVKYKWLRFFEPHELPKDLAYILQSWDTAYKCGADNDYSVGTTWGVSGTNFYLIDVFRNRLEYPALKRSIVERFRKFDPFKVLVEDKASGMSLLQELRSEGIWCLESRKPEPGSDKHRRLAEQSIKFEAGRVFLPKQAPWLDEYVLELTSFPGSKYDDQVDSTTQALECLGPIAPLTGPWRNPFPPRGYETC